MTLVNRFGKYATTALVASSLVMAAEPATRRTNFLPPQDSGSAASTFNNTGCLLDARDSVVMTDADGQKVWELRGSKKANFKKFIGKRTVVVGVIDPSATAKAGATKAAKSGTVQVVTVAGLKLDKDQTGAGCEKLAGLLGASVAAGAGAAAAAGAATATSVAAAAGAATAAGIAVPAAAATVSAAAAAAVGGGIAAGAGVGAAAATGAIGGTSSPLY